MTVKLATFWHAEVQEKYINKKYVHASSSEDSSIRADVGWNWKIHYIFTELINNVFAEHIPKGIWTKKYCINMVSDDAKEIPIGMITVAPAYSCMIHGETRSRTFIWYFSDAPAEFYAAFCMNRVKDVARAAMDTALVYSDEAGNERELFLRASPKGGDRLSRFYTEKCGMEKLNDDIFNPGMLRKLLGHSSDSFYYLNKDASQNFLNRFRESLSDTFQEISKKPAEINEINANMASKS